MIRPIMPYSGKRPFAFLILGILMSSGVQIRAEDWPMWRRDAQRTAVTTEKLADQLQVQWVREYSERMPTWEDPLNADVMSFDRIFEPIIVGSRLLMGFNDSDKVVAYDLSTGKELWSYFVDGPVRMPLAAADGMVFFTSDDGYLYALDVASGGLRWRFRGAPMDHRAIGNRRLISAWPARGGPVIYEDQVYFAASIWPFMGTFIYALDRQTGTLLWVNDETGSQYIKQPHSAPSFAGVGPQGALLATADALIVPGGRSVPAVFDRRTGKQRYFELNAGGKGTGGSFVAASQEHFYVHTRVKGTRQFTLHDGVKTAFQPNEPVIAGQVLYSAEVEKEVSKICAWTPDGTKLWDIEGDGTGDLILAGDVLYAAGSYNREKPNTSSITAMQLPQPNSIAKKLWSTELPVNIERLIAGNGKLVAVSREGNIYVLGDASVDHPSDKSEKPKTSQPPLDAMAQTVLSQGDASGYAFWFGSSDSLLLKQIVASKSFEQMIVVDQNASRVDSLRRLWDEAGLYGRHVSVHAHQAHDFRAPPYVANRILIEQTFAESSECDAAWIRKVYESVRPYGGVLQFLVQGGTQRKLHQQLEMLQLEQAKVSKFEHGINVVRVGALPGSSDWNHQYGNIANTIKSDDKLVKLPLGVLWFGGSSNSDTLPRHGHGPPEQVVGGRLILQGMNSLTARDVYTGRTLWHHQFKDLGTFDVYYDDSYADTPLDPAYNQLHIPGANARGTNYVVTHDLVYVIEGNRCHVLDTATGNPVRDIVLPVADQESPQEWGYIGVVDDVLIGGIGFAKYRSRLELQSDEDDAKLSKSKAGFGTKSMDRAASMSLVGFDRHSGKQLWKVDASHSFWHNGIVAGNGKIYALDRNPKSVEDLLKRRGRDLPKTHRILAFDAKTGDTHWEVKQGIFGTWLGYSSRHDMLLQAGAAASDRLATEIGQGMTVYRASDGSVVWSKAALAYSGPCILHNDLIITNANSYTESAGAFSIRDGSQKMVKNPITGRLQPWKITRAYGCNTISASENMLTFRSGAASYYDLLSESGTGNLGGFRSGCTSNLVAANGILNAPDLTRTCSCSYQNQSSIGLVHMPELETWSIDNSAIVQQRTDRIERLGINLGAPGDRRDANGVSWLEFPVVAGDSPSFGIEILGKYTSFQDHPATMAHARFPWISASGVQGLSGLRLSLKPTSPYKLREGVPIIDPSDDAEEGKDGTTSTSSSDLELVMDGTQQIVGLRFDRINLSSSSQIGEATIQFTAHAVNEEETELTIQAEMSPAPLPFEETVKNLSERKVTSELVRWRPAAWKKAEEKGSDQRTPDLSPLIQQLLRHPDWKPGNAIAFLIRGKGKRVATAYNGKEGAARLIIDADDVREAADPNVIPSPYRLKLVFGMPTSVSDSVRKFEVSIQGDQVKREIELDPSKTRENIVVFDRVLLGESLELSFTGITGEPILSGLEITKLQP